MSIAVLLSDKPPPRNQGVECHVETAPLDQLRNLGDTGHRIVILGDDAMLHLDPAVALSLMHRHSIEVWLSPHSISARILIPWIQAGFETVVHPEDIDMRLRLIKRENQRPRLPLSSWLPQVDQLEEPMLRAVRLNEQLDHPYSVSEWARRLAWSRHKLWRACQATFGETPREITWRYVEAVVRWARTHKWREEQIAELIGYSDASAIAHAFRRRGKRIPRRGKPRSFGTAPPDA